MNKVQGICLVIGPNGLVKNPMLDNKTVKAQEFEDVPMPNGNKVKSVYVGNDPSRAAEEIKKFVFNSFDLASETARQKSKSYPGQPFHVLQTVTIFQSDIKEPETLHFEIPK